MLLVPEIQMCEGVWSWYQNERRVEKSLIKFGGRKDAQLKHFERADELYPFQRVGAEFINMAGRALLCDETGLGKTATSIAAVVSSQMMMRVLVICPNSLKLWWADEIRRWDPTGRRVTVANSATREVDIKRFMSGTGWLVVNWELARIGTELLDQFVWDWMICDEAHRIKNRRTLTYKSVSQLMFTRLILATGTPMSNEPGELWSLLHLLAPSEFPSYWRFYEMYTEYKANYFGGREVRGVKNSELLRRELAPRMLRRTKKEFLPQLPDKTYKTVHVLMTPRQLKMYKQMVKESIIRLESGESVDAVGAIVVILRLQQILSTTATLDEFDSSGKLDAACELIADAVEETKVIVFTKFRKTVEALSQRLDKGKVKHVVIMGGMTGGVAPVVKQLQEDDEVRVAVCTLQAAGEGLTMTAATKVIFLEKNYNPATQQQAEDRVHRITQEKAVQIITVACRGTVDDFVQEILERKGAMTHKVLGTELLTHLKEQEEVGVDSR